MTNVILLGPSASGKTHMAHKLVGVDPPVKSAPTTRIDFLTCTISGNRINVWDTPACVEEQLPAIAIPLLEDCNFIVICYDGRREWTPVRIIDQIESCKCLIALTKHNAFNLPFSVETFDLVDTNGMIVPVFACNSTVDALTRYILRSTK